MRRSWVTLVMIGFVPVCVFYVLDWTGLTASLHDISTTMWELGHPFAWEVACMFASVISWIWVKGFAKFSCFGLSLSLSSMPYGLESAGSRKNFCILSSFLTPHLRFYLLTVR